MKKKKFLLIAIVIIFICVTLTSCGKKEEKPYKESEDAAYQAHLKAKKEYEKEKEEKQKKKSKNNKPLQIEERFFLTQINDIYANIDEYKNREITVEGMFGHLKAWDGREVVPVVFRYGPGCCGNDGWGGFMLKFKGKPPKDDEWIEVKGKPFIEETKEGYRNLYLKVKSMKPKSPRGEEKVMR